MERCRSGRTGRSRKPLYSREYRGFESLPLRHIPAGGPSGPFCLSAPNATGFEPEESTNTVRLATRSGARTPQRSEGGPKGDRPSRSSSLPLRHIPAGGPSGPFCLSAPNATGFEPEVQAAPRNAPLVAVRLFAHAKTVFGIPAKAKQSAWISGVGATRWGERSCITTSQCQTCHGGATLGCRNAEPDLSRDVAGPSPSVACTATPRSRRSSRRQSRSG